MVFDLIIPSAIGIAVLGSIAFWDLRDQSRKRRDGRLVRERAGRTPPLTRR